MINEKWLEWASKLQSISQAGLTYHFFMNLQVISYDFHLESICKNNRNS